MTTLTVRFPLVPSIFGLLGAGLVLLHTSVYGIGVSRDSASYLSLARNLIVGNGFTLFDGSAFTSWPPLFPLLLTTLGFVGWEPLESVRWVNAAAFGLITFIGSLWLIRLGVSRLAVVCGSFAIVMSTPVLWVSIWAWTEPLFILFALLSLIYTGSFLNNNRWQFVVLAAIFAALASLTRYVGVAVIATGFLLLLASFWLVRQRTQIRTRIVQTTTYLFISAAPLALWLFRNFMVSGELSSHGGTSKYSLLENIQLTIEALGNWILPTNDAIASTIGIFMLVPTVGVILFLISPHINGQTNWTRMLLAPLAVFTLVYIAFLTVSFSVVRIADPINDNRFLAPVYVPLVLTSVLTLERLYKTITLQAWRIRYAIGALIIGFCLTFGTTTIESNMKTLKKSLDQGWGKNSERWKKSDFTQFLRTHPLPGQIYSNSADLVYLSNPNPVRRVNWLRDLDSLLTAAQQSPSDFYVIWRKNYYPNKDHMESLASLAKQGKLQLEFDGEDGSVYRVSK